VPVKRRIDKRRRDLPSETITRLLEAQPIEFSEAAREVIIAAVYFRVPALPPEAEARGIKLLATWRDQSCV
jgi:hypothetical protein